MTFKTFLAEGQIKLPTGVLRKAQLEVLRYVCSYVLERLAGAKHEAYIKVAARLKARLAAKSLSVAKIAPIRSVLKLELDLSDLPARYKAPQEHSSHYDLVLQWAGTNSDIRDRNTGSYYDHKARPHVWLNVKDTPACRYDWARHSQASALPSHLKSMTVKDAEHELMDKIDDTLEHVSTSLEHELVHLVQHVVLRFSSPKVLDTNSYHELKQGTPEQEQAYYTSAVEFDPQVRSAAQRYIALERLNDKVDFDGDRGEWIPTFIGSSTKKAGYVELDPFFMHLKAADASRWRKAVKLFTRRVDQKHPR